MNIQDKLKIILLVELFRRIQYFLCFPCCLNDDSSTVFLNKYIVHIWLYVISFNFYLCQLSATVIFDVYRQGLHANKGSWSSCVSVIQQVEIFGIFPPLKNIVKFSNLKPSLFVCFFYSKMRKCS